MRKKKLDKPPFCDFCGKAESTHGHMVEGPGGSNNGKVPGENPVYILQKLP